MSFLCSSFGATSFGEGHQVENKKLYVIYKHTCIHTWVGEWIGKDINNALLFLVQSLNAKMIHQFIQKLEMNFSVKQIVRSEKRILQQLEYKVRTLLFMNF